MTCTCGNRCEYCGIYTASEPCCNKCQEIELRWEKTYLQKLYDGTIYATKAFRGTSEGNNE